jgi:hypothetical protein
VTKVDSFSFGSIVVGGRKYRRDLFLLPDGTVKRRKGGTWMFSGHTFEREEIEELSRTGAEVMVVGIGTDSQAKLSSEAKSLAEQAKLELHILPSDQTVTKFSTSCWSKVKR